MASSSGDVEDLPAKEGDAGDNKKNEKQKDTELKKEGKKEGGGDEPKSGTGSEESSPRRPPERKERTARREARKGAAPSPEGGTEEKQSGEEKGKGVGNDESVVVETLVHNDSTPAAEDDVDVVVVGGPLPTAIDGEDGKRVRRRKVPGSKDAVKRRTKSRDDPARKSKPEENAPKEEGKEVVKEEVDEKKEGKELEVKEEEEGKVAVPIPKEDGKIKVWFGVIREIFTLWRSFVSEEVVQMRKIRSQRNRCIGSMMLLIAYVGIGGIIFRFTEGAFETFYKCGVKRVKRDFVDGLWSDARSFAEDEWKSKARRRLMELEGQLHAAYDAGVTSYSGQRAWSFLNAVVYCLTVVTTIGYGHIAPATTTGRAITIAYAIFGIPMFLILLADFGKLFTRGIKFIWAFVRRVYYTGSCKKVRRTVPVQEVMKGVQLVYDFATFRRPSQVVVEGDENGEGARVTTSPSLGAALASPEGSASQGSMAVGTVSMTSVTPDSVKMGKTLSPGPMFTPAGNEPGTPALSTFEVDDEFNLPISVAIFILLLYIFLGATIYYSWEDWGFFESFYFVFISMSTIGFGDYVPQHPMYMMASIIYLVFGLALTSMCINVVQEKLSDSFRQASAKLGATMGLQVTEETEAAMAAQKVELAEVHSAGKKQNSI